MRLRPFSLDGFELALGEGLVELEAEASWSEYEHQRLTRYAPGDLLSRKWFSVLTRSTDGRKAAPSVSEFLSFGLESTPLNPTRDGLEKDVFVGVSDCPAASAGEWCCSPRSSCQ